MNPLEQHMERCTKCGICIDVCPRYGNIELIDTLYNFLRGDIATPDYDVKRCLTCNLCTSECPEELGIKMLISAARAKITKLQGTTPAQKIADPFSSRNIFRKFSEYRKPCTFAREGVDGELLFFPGCAGTIFFPRMSKAMEAILDKTGVNYTVMSGVDSCCGAVTAGTGNLEAAKKMAVKNIRNARERGVKKIITTCPGCFTAFTSLYPEFVTMDFEVLQSSQYLKILIDEGRIKLNEIPAKVFYHDPCHLTRGMGVYEAPREILNKIPGTVLINPSTKGSACCGFGGGVRGNFPSDSMELAGDRHRYAKALGSDILITNCAGCLQNLLEGKKDSDLDIFDLAEYVAAAMGIEKTSTEEEDRETIQLINTVYSQCLPHYPEK